MSQLVCMKSELISTGSMSSNKFVGFWDTRLGNIYRLMKGRCYNPNNPAFKNYGGRGIKVCSEWLDESSSFYEWALTSGYNDDLTLERINVDSSYEPENCTWVTKAKQARNRRNNISITINGETHCLKEWCEILNIGYVKVANRIRRGMDPLKALEVLE